MARPYFIALSYRILGELERERGKTTVNGAEEIRMHLICNCRGETVEESVKTRASRFATSGSMDPHLFGDKLSKIVFTFSIANVPKLRNSRATRAHWETC